MSCWHFGPQSRLPPPSPCPRRVVAFEGGVGVDAGVGVGPGVGPPVREGVPVGVVPGGGDVATGLAPGEVFAIGVGEASATPDTTCSAACAWQAFFQQIFTM